MMRLAVPTGRLWTHSQKLLAAMGFRVHAVERRYVFHHPVSDLEVLTLKIPDIPAAVDEGLVDVAIASDEWLAEHNGRYINLFPLCWYHVRICLLAPERSTIDTDGATPALTIATPYPRLATRLLSSQFRIRPVAGAVEAYPGHVTDLAIDCVETGLTARINGLVIARELLRADVRLVAAPTTDLTNPVAREVMSMILASAPESRCHFGGLPDPVGRR